MTEKLPAWVGWPGAGPGPGHDWLPGSALRVVALLLAYAFLALALTVDYAASVTFFLLAMLGMYVGLRRGFINGLSRAEKLALLIFAAYPAVAIASYLVGTQTNVGFRVVGRELRLALFVPIYIALRWSRPQQKWVGYALCVGVALATADAIAQVAAHGSHFHASGVAGVAITFGDLVLLGGFLGALALVNEVRANGLSLASRTNILLLLWGTLGVAGGVTSSVLSESRGGWLAFPILLGVLLVRVPFQTKAKFASLLVLAVLGFGILVPLHGLHDVVARTRQGWKEFRLYTKPSYDDRVSSSIHSMLCPDSPAYLRTLAMYTDVTPRSTRNLLRVVPDVAALSSSGWSNRCRDGMVLELEVPSGLTRVRLAIPRSLRESGRQVVSVLARGRGLVWAQWPGAITRVDSSDYRVYTATGTSGRRSYLHVSAEPGQSIQFIPLQRTFGEYSFIFDENAVGERFALWDAAIRMFLRYPSLGVGTGAFEAHARALVERHKASPVVWPYDHAHSDFLNRLASTGAIGLISLLLLYAVPLLGRRHNSARQGVGMGKALAAGLVIFGLTETMLAHSLVLSWVVVAVATVLALHSESSDSTPRVPET